MFRGKESSNRIELSRLVQDIEFWCFGLPAALGVGGWVYGGGGWFGGVPYTHAHACACTHMHAHARVVKMIISCKWPPPLGESLGIPYDVTHACTCVYRHVCACVWGAPSHHPPFTSTYPPPLRGGTPGINQNSIALELIKIFQFHLKI